MTNPIVHKSESRMSSIDLSRSADAALPEAARDFGIPVERIVAAAERPKVESHGQSTLVVLQLPLLADCEGELVTHELRLLLGRQRFAAVHDGKLPAIGHVREQLAAAPERPSASAVLEVLLNAIVDTRLELVDMLAAEIGRLENKVFETAGRQDQIRDVMRLRRHACTLQRIVATQLDLFERLSGDTSKAPLYRDAFGQVLHSLRHLRVLIEGLRSRASIVADAHEAFIGHTLNNTLKVLTVFSVIMIPPTLIAGLFGMNVHVPFQEHGEGFLGIVLGMVGVALGFVGYLRYKRLI